MLFWKAEEKLWDVYELEEGELVLELLTLCLPYGDLSKNVFIDFM